MTLKEIVNSIVSIAKAQPNVNSTFVGDIYELNHYNDVDYSAFVVTQQQHNINNEEGYIAYNFNLFYVDRLTADESNRLDVQSTAISFLNAVIADLEMLGLIINDYTINTFNEKFNDVCAGAYATLAIRANGADCGDNVIKIITDQDLTTLTVTENGTYKGLYKEVNVNVSGTTVLDELVITENGEYAIPKGISYKKIIVNVQQPQPPTPTMKDYLKFENTHSPKSTGIAVIGYDYKTINLQYSFDGEDWDDCDDKMSIALPEIGDVVYLRGENSTLQSATKSLRITCYSGMTVSGNIMSLLSDDFEDLDEVPDYCFKDLFKSYYNTGGVTDISQLKLPATKLGKHCYEGMFKNHTNITKAPTLPASTLTEGCYNEMFSGCSKLNHIKVGFTDYSATDALTNWVDGVATNGTFVQPLDSTFDVRGTSGIPENWNIERY